MRSKRWSLLVLLSVIVLLGYAYVGWVRFGHHAPGASVSIGKQEAKGGAMVISALTVNTGRIPLVYHGSPPFADVRVETDRGWTNVGQQYVSKSASFGYLLPGRSLSYQFTVPVDVTHVQVGCYFKTGGARTWAAGHLLEAGWWNRLEPVSRFVLPLLPDGRKEVFVFWSSKTKINY